MPKPLRPNRLQILLATAVVLTVVAGGIIWANVGERSDYFPGGQVCHQESGKMCRLFFRTYGWPFAAGEYLSLVDIDGVTRQAQFRHRPNYFMAALDLAVALSVLFAVWFICERLIRRRAARTEA